MRAPRAASAVVVAGVVGVLAGCDGAPDNDVGVGG